MQDDGNKNNIIYKYEKNRYHFTCVGILNRKIFKTILKILKIQNCLFIKYRNAR